MISVESFSYGMELLHEAIPKLDLIKMKGENAFLANANKYVWETKKKNSC